MLVKYRFSAGGNRHFKKLLGCNIVQCRLKFSDTTTYNFKKTLGKQCGIDFLDVGSDTLLLARHNAWNAGLQNGGTIGRTPYDQLEFQCKYLL